MRFEIRFLDGAGEVVRDWEAGDFNETPTASIDVPEDAELMELRMLAQGRLDN